MYELHILDFMCERKIEDTFEIYRNKERCVELENMSSGWIWLKFLV